MIFLLIEIKKKQFPNFFQNVSVDCIKHAVEQSMRINETAAEFVRRLLAMRTRRVRQAQRQNEHLREQCEAFGE